MFVSKDGLCEYMRVREATLLELDDNRVVARPAKQRDALLILEAAQEAVDLHDEVSCHDLLPILGC